MKTAMELRAANMAARDACARRALLQVERVSAVEPVVAPDLGRWEAVRAQMARLKLPWGVESAAVLAAVAAHRAYWRPEAGAAAGDLGVARHGRGRPSSGQGCRSGCSGTRRRRRRSCGWCTASGYGERDLLQGRVQGNFGSPQFWRLLAGSLDAALVSQVVERNQPDLIARVTAKLSVLTQLKARGVWLLDASPVALYAASQPAPKIAVTSQALELAWSAYTREAIRAAQPRAVMIVGKMVHDAIGGRIRALLGPSVPVQWMYQPQARRPAPERAAGVAGCGGWWRRRGEHGEGRVQVTELIEVSCGGRRTIRRRGGWRACWAERSAMRWGIAWSFSAGATSSARTGRRGSGSRCATGRWWCRTTRR